MLLERLRKRAPTIPSATLPQPDDDYLRELNEAYQHFFFHYTATPLLVVETSQFDPEYERRGARRPGAQITGHGQGHALLRAADVKPACSAGRHWCQLATAC